MNGLAHGSRLLSRQIVAILDCKVTKIANEPHTARVHYVEDGCLEETRQHSFS